MSESETKTLEQRILLLEKEIRNLKRQNQATIHQLSQVSKLLQEHEILRQQLQDDFK